MVDSIQLECRIQFTDAEAEPLAAEIAAGLKEAGVETTPAYDPPAQATYGTPEVILTIAVAAVAKAVVVAGLRALERRLKQSKTKDHDRRIQIVINSPGKPRKRFPFSLHDVTDDTIHEFISGVIDFIAAV
jgi:hypothetical protein